MAVGVADKLAMLRYSVFSVISPEGCAAILWNDPAKVETATEALNITPDALLHHGLIDDIVEEPEIGAHRDREGAANAIKAYFLKAVEELGCLSSDERLTKRYDRIVALGKFTDREG